MEASYSLGDAGENCLVTLDRQPVLKSELVVVRPLTRGDFDDLYSIASDARIWEQHPSKDRTDRHVFQVWYDEALASKGALVAEDAVTHDVIGTSRFVVRSEDVVEIGWTFLAHDRWGGMWNREIKRLMLSHAFDDVPEVIFTIHSDNLRSQRAVERLGAEHVGTEPDCHGRGQNRVYRLSRAR